MGKLIKFVSGLVLMIFFLTLTSTFGFATPSTHIWAPSTDVQAFKKWHLTSDFYFPSERDSAGNRPSTITNLGLTIGVLPFEKLNMEVGFDHKTGTGDLDDYPIYFNTKLGIPEKALGEYFPALAIGIYDVGTENNKTDYNVVYGKLAKTINLGDFILGKLSAGYFRGDSTLLVDGNGNKDNDGILACWERNMTEISDKLWVAVDYQGSDSAYGSTNLGFSWKFSDNTSVIFGYDIYNNRNLADTVTVQLDIDF